MSLIHLNQVSIAFGVHPLLDRADLSLQAGERVGLIGRNGEGKSTLMKIIAGDIQPEDGDVWRDPGAKLALLEQAPVFQADDTIYDAVIGGFGNVGMLLAQYHQLVQQAAPDLEQLSRLQQQLEQHDGWALQQQVETVLSKLDLPADRPVAALSGGWKRRVALARALVLQPDMLLLDEPTNHIDIETILWLQQQLQDYRGVILLVTHDRSFLQAVATRIIELDRGQLTSWSCSYLDYLQRKATALEDEARHNALFDKRLAEEEVWIRQGIKARRTRNEGRVRALKKMREERAQRRNRIGQVNLKLDSGELSGKRVIEAKNVTFSYDGQAIVQDFSGSILRGDRIGLIGPNGAGKSTLIQLLLQQLTPDSGSIEHGTKLEIAYFDQLRTQLDPEQTIAEAVGNGSETVTVGGRQQHIMSYLSDFLFQPARARTPIRSLSGGEKNRVMLARLFSQPANLLIMDEPTNDLDIETLELLEELLLQYEGTLLLVSHDRTFLDNIVTSSLVFEGNGRIGEYMGGYSDWLRQKPAEPERDKTTAAQAAAKPEPDPARPVQGKQKLSYKEQRELEQLPARIEGLEAQQSALTELTASAEFYQNEPVVISQTLAELETVQQQLEQAYARWDALETEAAVYETSESGA